MQGMVSSSLFRSADGFTIRRTTFCGAVHGRRTGRSLRCGRGGEGTARRAEGSTRGAPAEGRVWVWWRGHAPACSLLPPPAAPMGHHDGSVADRTGSPAGQGGAPTNMPRMMIHGRPQHRAPGASLSPRGRWADQLPTPTSSRSAVLKRLLSLIPHLHLPLSIAPNYKSNQSINIGLQETKFNSRTQSRLYVEKLV